MSNTYPRHLPFNVQPAHMPQGTQFRIKIPALNDRGGKYDRVFTVAEVVRAGTRNFIAYTTTPWELDKELTHMFSLDHVSEIIKRGDGSCEVADERWEADQNMDRLRRLFAYNSQDRKLFGSTARKKFKVITELNALILHYQIQTGYKGRFDMGRTRELVNRFEGVHFWLKEVPGKVGIFVWHVDTVWLKKFVKRNVTRMLMNYDEDQAREKAGSVPASPWVSF